MKKNLIPLAVLGFVGLALTSCSGSGYADVVYSVPEGTEKVTTNKWDRNQDGTLGYVLMKGEDGNPEAEARTDGLNEGMIDIGKDTTVDVAKLAQQTMRDPNAGAWHAPTAKNTFDGWASQYGDKIDAILSNNDGMAYAVYESDSYKNLNNPPIFGFDALPTVLDAIIEGKGFAGTISQNGNDQGFLCALVTRALLDGASISATGEFTGTNADHWNELIKKMNHDKVYDNTYKNFASKVTPVTTKADAETLKAGETIDLSSDTTTYTEKNVFVCGYKAGDDFLANNVYPAIQEYCKHFNLKINNGGAIVMGDGNQDSKIYDQMTDLAKYDAFIINVQTNTAWNNYVERIDQAKPGAPIVFYNRQPSKSENGSTVADPEIANRKNTFFVGTARDGQGEAMQEMVVNWYTANK